ncbi:transmembrane protein, putative [Medicago truncatula]|uniref:Transmembrane protein, putative n=1 Tax=Medicago truncatula TaxID=3880 RepID=A0A072TZ33_MEDTR|nr:transmembrane protein, putative [Medicago truncatula]
MRSLRQYSFRKPDLLSLRKLGKKVVCMDDFYKQHGNLMGVVKTDIDEGILNAFVQFYDPGYHCFTFQDYQILPTLEEYSCWINLPVLDKVPFSGLEETPKHSTIATALHLETDEVKAHLITRGKFLGFSTDFLYERTTFFDKMGVAYAFNSILALLIYGLVLFPSLDNFVDIKAIQIFLSRNPVPTLLENLLWSKRLMSLTPAEVVWYDRVYDKGTIIDSCGKFSNVPLLGLEGGISYNPTLARRQFGYPMEGKPLSIYLENVYYLNIDDSKGMREQVVRAWHTIRRRDKGQLGKKTGAVHESYTQWVIDRAVQIGMPYKISRFVSAITPAPPLPMTFDTEKEYQERLAEVEREVHRWKREYQKKDQEYEAVMVLLEQEAYDSHKKDMVIAQLRKSIKEKDAALDQIPGRKKKRMDLFDRPHSDFED